MTGYYDLVLGLIPVALLGITAALTVVGLSLTSAVPVGAVVAATLIGHAMFVNGPGSAADTTTDPSRSQSSATSRSAARSRSGTGPVNAD